MPVSFSVMTCAPTKVRSESSAARISAVAVRPPAPATVARMPPATAVSRPLPGSGLLSQSTRFFTCPGNEALYCGLTNHTPSAWRTA